MDLPRGWHQLQRLHRARRDSTSEARGRGTCDARLSPPCCQGGRARSADSLSVVVAPTGPIGRRVKDGQYVGPRAAPIHRRTAREDSQGALATLAREIPGNAIFFATYELAQSAFPRWTRAPGSPAKRLRTKARGRLQPPSLVRSSGATSSSASSSASPPPRPPPPSPPRLRLRRVRAGGLAAVTRRRRQVRVLARHAPRGLRQDADQMRRGDLDDASVEGDGRDVSRAGRQGLYAGAGPLPARVSTNAVQFLAWRLREKWWGVGRA